MCTSCGNEYNDVTDRRFFLKPILVQRAVLNCNTLINNNLTQVLSLDMDTIINAIKDGKIAAVKGIGGFLLICDATNEEAINKLRHRKHRPTKPFAVMYPTIEMLEQDVILRTREKKLLKSPQSPIVLLSLKIKLKSRILTYMVLRNLSQIGAVLPYTPLFELITEGVGKPLIATSGNISGSLIILEDNKAYEHLSEIADLIITNNREIVVPQDDFIIKFSFFKEKQTIIRRSRGYVPTFLLKIKQIPSRIRHPFQLWAR